MEGMANLVNMGNRFYVCSLTLPNEVYCLSIKIFHKPIRHIFCFYKNFVKLLFIFCIGLHEDVHPGPLLAVFSALVVCTEYKVMQKFEKS